MKITGKIIAFLTAVSVGLAIAMPCFGELFYEENTSALSVSAKSAILIEADTGTVLFAKNEKEHRAIASTTKIMTALLTLEAGDLDKPFTVDEMAIQVEGTSMWLRKEDIVTRRALCYGMLLPSGNDAANCAAVNVAGSIDGFAVLMNKKATSLGMLDSSFVTPSGLDAENQYSCAYDMALLTREALKNETFAEICASAKAKVSYGNPPYDRWLINSNKLLYDYPDCIGVKTGFTDDARRTLVSAAERNGVTLIAVTLNAPDDWQDHTKMLDYGFSVTENSDVKYNCDSLRAQVVGSDKTSIAVDCEKVDLSLTDSQREKLKTDIHLPKFLYADIKYGDKVGRVDYILDGRVIASADLTAMENADRKNISPGFFEGFIMLLKRLM